MKLSLPPSLPPSLRPSLPPSLSLARSLSLSQDILLCQVTCPLSTLPNFQKFVRFTSEDERVCMKLSTSEPPAARLCVCVCVYVCACVCVFVCVFKYIDVT
jgi:hypothetical protein